MAEEIRELGLNLSGLPTHDPRTPGTLPGDVARFVDLADRVANPTALAALDTTTFLSGKTRIAEVHSLAAFFYFDSTSAATADGTTVIAPAVGSGRWLIWPGGGSTIPRVADITALAALPTSGYPTTTAHLAEVIITQALWRFFPVTTLGAFSNVAPYVTGNKVFYLGSIYVAIANTTANLPTNVAFWRLYFGGVSGITLAANDLLGMWCRLSIADVANLASLALVPGICLPSATSTVCFVATVGAPFKYVAGGTATVDGITVVTSADGLGQWHRMDVPNQVFIAARFWAVDPVSGSDEAQGWGADQTAAEAVPLKTMAELNRRFVGMDVVLTSILRISILNDIPLTDNVVLTNLRATGNNTAFVNIVGKRTQVGPDYVVSAYATENRAANTGFLVTATGLDATKVDLMAQNAAGTVSAIVQSCPSTNTLRLTMPNDSDPETGLVSYASPAAFSVGDTIRFFRFPRMPRIQIDPTVQVGQIACMRLGYGSAAQGDISAIGGMAFFAIQCVTEGLIVLGGVGCGWTCVGFRPGSDSVATILEHHNAFCVGTGVRGTGLFLLKETDYEVSWHDIEAGQMDVESSQIVCGGNSPISAFNCPALPTPGALSLRAFSRLYMLANPGTSAVYGSGNAARIVSVEKGCRAIMVPKADFHATTSAASPLAVDGVAVQISDLPYVDLSTESSVIPWA